MLKRKQLKSFGRKKSRQESSRYETLEPRNLLAAVIGADVYSPQAIADPFVRDAVTYQDMVARATVHSYMPGELIVAVTANSQGSDFADHLESIDWNEFIGREALQGDVVDSSREMMTVERGEDSIALVHLKFANPDTDVFQVMEQLDNDDSVLWTSPNFYETKDPTLYTPNDPQYANQYHHTLMSNDLAWDITFGDASVVVATPDDGFELNHDDLEDSYYVNAGEIAGDGIDNDGNGYVDDVSGWDFINGNNDPNPEATDHSHGTHVGGIVAAQTDNGVGVAGTAGGVTLMPLQWYDYDAWPASVIAETFTYATDNGAQIVSASYVIDPWVGDAVYTAGLQYMYDAGVLSLNASGNSSVLNQPAGSFHQVLLVASSTSTDEVSGFSNYGRGIDITAPGSAILSTVVGNTYSAFSGTSMAAPNAAAVAALIWSVNPEWTRDQVAAQLVGTADNIDAENPGYENWVGGGRTNSFAAITATLDGPQVNSVATLPAAGTDVDDLTIDSFSIRFDQVLDPATINNMSNLELRSAGPDNVFGNADDVLYPVSNDVDYMIAANDVDFTIDDGTLDYGQYRLTLSSGITNPFGTLLDGNGDGTSGDAYVQEFFISPPKAGVVVFDSSGYMVGETVGVSVTDANTGASTVGVTIVSSGGDSESLTLSGSGAVYTNTISTLEGSATANDGTLQVALGDILTVTYIDLDDGFGNSITVSDTANINNVFEFPAADLPIDILDNTTITSTITIADAGTIADADLQLDITHTYDADLTATLTSPDGTVFTLFSGVGGSDNDFDMTYLDDEAAISINAGSAPFSGSYQPADSFGPIDGMSITGDWVLSITDSFGADQGTLNSWSLFLDVIPDSSDIGPVTDSDSAANEAFENATVGSTVGITALAVDSDSGDVVTYSLTSDAGGLFVIDPNSGVVTVAAVLDYETATSHSITVEANSSDGSSNEATYAIAVRNVSDAVLMTSNLYYVGSDFADAGDFAAVATDKQPLLPGQTATFANYTSYSLGINGMALELNDANEIPTVGNINDFFTFKVGNDNTPDGWATAPTPIDVVYQSNVDAAGTDRVFVSWADNAIQNQWLQISILANATTGMANQEVFYFGNAIGETGDDANHARVNLVDVGLVRVNQTGFTSAPIESLFDVNRDGRVNLVDVGLVRVNQTGFNSLALISPPASAPDSGGRASGTEDDNTKSKSFDQIADFSTPRFGAASFDTAFELLGEENGLGMFSRAGLAGSENVMTLVDKIERTQNRFEVTTKSRFDRVESNGVDSSQLDSAFDEFKLMIR